MKGINKGSLRLIDKGYRMFDYTMMRPYLDFCAKRKIPKSKRFRTKELEIFSRRLFKEIGEQIVEKEGGVFIKNLGYFFVLIHKGGKGFKTPRGHYVRLSRIRRLKTNVIFIPNYMHKDLSFWGTGNRELKETIYKRIRKNFLKGKRYKAYPYTMRKLLRISPEEKWQPYFKGKNDE